MQKVKNILSKGFRKKHAQNYNEEVRLQKEIELKRERDSIIEKRQRKINQNTKLQQQIDPGFLDALIYSYYRRNNTINDKIEIFKEIQKYNCNKTVTFFRKLNDSERNDEIRNLAFQHLQKTGHYVKLRKKFKGKKKQYYTEKDTFFGTPELLLEKLQKASLTQRVKHFDLFISHSSKDIEIVNKIVNLANVIGLNCYVDWLSDDNFLKRSMVSEYTREVLKFRLSQSKKLLYLSSSNSRKSPWVIFELDYFQNTVKREMKMILLEGTDERALKYIHFSELNKEKLDKLLQKNIDKRHKEEEKAQEKISMKWKYK